MKYILFISLFSIQGHCEDMQRAVMNALYKQTGTEVYIDRVVKDLDKEYLPDALRTNGAVALMLLQCTVTRQVGWKWSF